MANNKTGIEWTDKTWNPTTGCDKISTGCQHCYAEEMTKRFPNGFSSGFDVTLHESRLKTPLKWRKASKVFVNSMSDLFHDKVPYDFIDKVMETISKADKHIFQVLTKRPERMRDYFETCYNKPLPDNLWLGVSVENQNYVNRIDYLKKVPAKVRFLSCEPLLGDLELDLTDIHWVIVGGESGNKYRPIKEEWVLHIKEQCELANVAFFFKQWGGYTPKAKGRLLQGKEYNQFPQL